MEHTFPLVVGEIIKIGEVPYRYVGDGLLAGGTAPEFAREMNASPRAGSCEDTARPD